MSMPRAVYRELHLLPSILSADFSRLGQQIEAVMDAGVRIIHVDVMDGHFVPNITIGPLVVSAVAPLVHRRGGWLSVHLMIERPEDYFEAFAKAGADVVSFHVEACAHLYHAVEAVKTLGVGAGVALNPGTDVSRLTGVASLVDLVLVMTVNPGFGGQALIRPALERVPELRRMLPEGVAIELDGGVNRDNIREVVKSGANWIVAGSAVFGAADPGVEAGDSPRALRGRPGVIPGPTVKVWKREGRSGTVVSCLPLTPGHRLKGFFVAFERARHAVSRACDAPGRGGTGPH
jgi:ribulose-phosphate 3-epimerase